MHSTLAPPYWNHRCRILPIESVIWSRFCAAHDPQQTMYSGSTMRDLPVQILAAVAASAGSGVRFPGGRQRRMLQM